MSGRSTRNADRALAEIVVDKIELCDGELANLDGVVDAITAERALIQANLDACNDELIKVGGIAGGIKAKRAALQTALAALTGVEPRSSPASASSASGGQQPAVKRARLVSALDVGTQTD